jgi:hypothetical protein
MIESNAADDALFAYTSEVPLTIQIQSQLTLDEDVTFSYAPTNNAPDLFRFINSTSELNFTGGELVSTHSLHLTKGTIHIMDNSNISTSGLNYDIVFGNHTAADDLTCIIARDESLRVTNGVLSYRNVLPSSWLMEDDLSRLRMFTGTHLRLYESLDVRPARIEFDGNNVMAQAAGKTFTGSIFPFGKLTRLFNLS